MSPFITGEQLKAIWSSYEISGEEAGFARPPDGPFYLLKDMLSTQHPVLVSSHKTEQEATDAFWNAIAEDVATMVAEVIINGGPHA